MAAGLGALLELELRARRIALKLGAAAAGTAADPTDASAESPVCASRGACQAG